MNKSYRLVWSAVRGAWTVVSELAKSHAKSGAAIVVVAAATVAAPAQGAISALVTEGTVTGDLIVDQPATRAIDVVPGKTVTFSGSNFNISTISGEAILANGANALVTEANSGATYNFTSDPTVNGVYSLMGAGLGGRIDFSKAQLVDIKTSFGTAVFASQGGLLRLVMPMLNTMAQLDTTLFLEKHFKRQP